MRFAIYTVVLLCAFQASSAGLIPTFQDVIDRVQAAQGAADVAISAARNFIVDGVAGIATGAVEAVNGAVNLAQAGINALVDEAQADGVAAAECGILAAANFTKITTDLPITLTNCLTDRLDVFDTYVQKINSDFVDILLAIPTAIHDSAECWVGVMCQSQVYLNLTAYETKKNADIAFQLLQIELAKVNLVASTTTCDIAAKTQALLDVTLVTPKAVTCIANKRAEIKAQS